MDDSDFRPLPSPFVSRGGDLPLSNRGQLDLLCAVSARGAQFRATVRGSSVTPFIRDQDVLTIGPLNGVAPRVGEVVAFVVPNWERLVIHRVITRVGDAWLIRGDNCTEADGFIQGEHILGRVTRVERRGGSVHFSLGPEARLVAWFQRANVLMPAVRAGRWVRQRLSVVNSRLTGTRS